jgi:hypothetical protein
MRWPPGTRWAAIFGPPALLILGLAGWAAWPAVFGSTILLATGPVDPNDPFRGDYVVLNLDVGTVGQAWGFQEGDPIYVTLEPGPEREPGTGDPFWTVVEAHRERPDVKAGQACLQGTVRSADGRAGGDGRVRVAYGIEDYFIPKDETLESWRGKTVSVEAKVHGCTARLVAVRLDGVPWPDG